MGRDQSANGNVEFSKGKTDTLLIGDSMVRYLDRTFQSKNKKKRLRVCYPGARVSDIVVRIDREIDSTNVDSEVIVHVGTNDIGHRRSEELIADYRRLIQKMKASGRRCMISGILPRLGAGQEWGIRALGVNERVKKLCFSENIWFLDLWRISGQIYFCSRWSSLGDLSIKKLGKVKGDGLNLVMNNYSNGNCNS